MVWKVGRWKVQCVKPLYLGAAAVYEEKQTMFATQMEDTWHLGFA